MSCKWYPACRNGENLGWFILAHMSDTNDGARLPDEEESRLLDALLVEYQAGRITMIEAARRIEECSPGSVAASLLVSGGAVRELMDGRIAVGEAERLVREQADRHPAVPEVFVDLAAVASRREPVEDMQGYFALAKLKSDLFIRSEFVEELLSPGGGRAPLTPLVEEVARRPFVWKHYGEKGRDHLVEHFLLQDVSSAEERYLEEEEVGEVLFRSDRLGPLLAAIYYDVTHLERDPPDSLRFVARLLGELKPREAVAPIVEALEVCEGELLHEAVLTLAKLGSVHAERVSSPLKALASDPDMGSARLPAIEALGFLWPKEGNLEFLEGFLRELDPGDPEFDELFKFVTWALLRTGLSRGRQLVDESLEERGTDLHGGTVEGVRRSLETIEPYEDRRLDGLLAEDVYELCCGPLDEINLMRRMTMTRIRELAISGELEELLEKAPADRPFSREFPRAGRNDPCPCGSGKKFKKCCLAKVEEGRSEAGPGRLSEEEVGALGRLVEKLTRFTRSRQSATDPAAAMNEYFREGRMRSVTDEEEADSPVPLGDMVADWFLFGRVGEGGETVADEFARVRGSSSLPREEREMLEAVRGGRFSVYEVLEVRPEEGLGLLDIFTGEVLDVSEVSATRSLVRWDLMAGRVGPVGGHLEIVSPIFTVPLEARERLETYIKRKAKEAVSRGDVADVNDYVNRKSFLLAAYTHKQAMKMFPHVVPTVLTAEGDLFCRSVAYYDVEDPAKARELLSKHPHMEARPKESGAGDEGFTFDWFLSEEMERELGAGEHLGPPMQPIGEGWPEPDGSAEETEIGEPRRMFGVLTLSRRTLTFETNSRERLDMAKRELVGCLGEVASHRVDSFEDQEALLGGAGKRRGEADPAEAASDLDPEVERRLVTAHAQRHYASWPDIPLPALDGKTPREAARTRAGRRKVNALIKQFENKSERAARAGKPAFDFSVLRSELGIPQENPE